MKLDETQNDVVQFTITHEDKLKAKLSRIEQMLIDAEREFITLMNTLVEKSVGIKKVIDGAKTQTKDTYYISRLTKNNEVIYETMMQYEKTKNALTEMKTKIENELTPKELTLEE